MLGLFGTLDLARRSMQTQMTGVEVAGHNLANVNTTGYSRQRANITTSLVLPTVIGPEGTGAQVVRIQQIVNTLLNGQIQSQASTNGYWAGQQAALQSAQNGLNEFLNNANGTSGSGLSSQLNSLFSAFQSVATSPNSISARQALVGAAQNLATMFNQVGNQFSNLKTALNTSLNRETDAANQLLAQVADLNKQISTTELGGGQANDLRDQRTLALENLSQLTNITTSAGANGTVDISIGGQSLVSGRQVLDTLATYDAGGGQLLLKTATGGVNLALAGGSMQGTIAARDGELAAAQSQVDALATNLIAAVNTVHSGGFGLNGSTGANFFNGTSAATMSVNQALVNDPSLIQAAGSATATGDNSVMLSLSQLAAAAQSGLSNQTFNQFYGATVASLGTALGNANTQVANQQAVTDMLTVQRGSVSGVNIDEEMTNLLSFQRAYTASAELLKTVDQMIQVTLSLKS